MTRTTLMVIGAATFGVVHLALTVMWQTWFRGGDGLAPWFMNSFETVGWTLAVFAAVAFCVSALDHNRSVGTPLTAAMYIAFGAAAPMIVVLFTMRGGPGNLFPIAIVIGWLIFFVASIVGGVAGWAIRFWRP